MKRVKNRAVATLLLAALILACLGIYVVKLAVNGEKWVSFAPNKSVFKNGTLISGTLEDRNGVVLSTIVDGERVYAESSVTRRSTLHAVGDSGGKIGSAALNVYASKLIGYNFITGTYSRTESGKTVQLSIDSRLNDLALEALAGRSGTVAVMNYETGELLCMVSTPTFDPSSPPDDVETSSQYEGVYLNRFLSATYTPGSTFKLITTAAAIECIDDIFDRTFVCDGSALIGDGKVTCSTAHGTMSFEDALAVSCNCTFGALAVEIGAETLSEYMQDYGFTEHIDACGSMTAAGRFDEAESDFNLAWSGVGQYNTLICPAAMLRFSAAIANDGVAVPVSILQSSGLLSFASKGNERIMKASTAERLSEMMNYNLHKTYGTSNYPGLELHAKSGTAEVGSDVRPHSWFTGFITNDGYPLAFVVVVENGGGGSAVAGPIANAVLQHAISN